MEIFHDISSFEFPPQKHGGRHFKPPQKTTHGAPNSLELPPRQSASARQRCANQSAQLAASLRSKLTELEVSVGWEFWGFWVGWRVREFWVVGFDGARFSKNSLCFYFYFFPYKIWERLIDLRLLTLFSFFYFWEVCFLLPFAGVGKFVIIWKHMGGCNLTYLQNVIFERRQFLPSFSVSM